MEQKNIQQQLKRILAHTPTDWLSLTTHRLDIYEEDQAKTQFLQAFEELMNSEISGAAFTERLAQLPTAYDYIRLGHPLSSVLEWSLAQLQGLSADRVICFQSLSMPLLAIARKNSLAGKVTQIAYSGNLPAALDQDLIRKVYGYEIEWLAVENPSQIQHAPGYKASASLVYVESNFDWTAQQSVLTAADHPVDYFVGLDAALGSVLYIGPGQEEASIGAIQHVRRRETVAITPLNAYRGLQRLANEPLEQPENHQASNQKEVADNIRSITGTSGEVLVASSGLSMQYAIMMGLVDYALEQHPGKQIKFIVPPNCYGGTNDQARRLAQSLEQVSIVDLPVDRDNDMVSSVEQVLSQLAQEDAVPYIIAEIPTNPRVEVPDLEGLAAALRKSRQTPNGTAAIAPVFILDQTFCPNVPFLSQKSDENNNNILAEGYALAYASGSKFPSGGKCTAGYCVGNQQSQAMMNKIATHLTLCDNEATARQYAKLAEQLPSMLERIEKAYRNTRAFVEFIKKELPEAKINFVSEDLAQRGFTPSVFSLDLPTKGDTPQERETYKRALNHKLIQMMITQIPKESKYCVSYGQLKGCYWTIPATSTQGTTKETDKDYIVRVSLAPELDLERHQSVFRDFVQKHI